MDGTLVVLVLAAALVGVAVIRALAHQAQATYPGSRRPAWLPSAAAAVAGAGLVAVGYTQAGRAAPAADADFAEYVRAKGGSVVSAPGFPDTYRQAAAGGHLLWAGLVGGAGLVLLGVGAAGLARPWGAGPPNPPRQQTPSEDGFPA
jgi:hypothetical protein